MSVRGAAPALLAAWVAAAAAVLPPPAMGHPALERETVNHHLKGPGAQSSRRLPLGIRPIKSYLPAKAAAPAGAASGTSVFQGLLRFFRTAISPVDGNRCAMAPTCSLYSHQAMAEHGVLAGVLLTAGRLLHEGDEIPRARKIRENGETLYLDPLEANTYWWPEWLK